MERLEWELYKLSKCIDSRKFFIYYDDGSGGIKTRAEIQAKVSELFDIPIEVMKSKTRKGEAVKARQLCMWYEKHNTKYSLSTIGFEFGKDHATVINACRKIDELIETKDAHYYPLIKEFIKFTEQK